MLRFTGVMKLPGRVRSGVDLFASDDAAQNHCEKGDPDHDTNNFKDSRSRHQMFLCRRLAFDSRIQETQRHGKPFICRVI